MVPESSSVTDGVISRQVTPTVITLPLLPNGEATLKITSQGDPPKTNKPMHASHESAVATSKRAASESAVLIAHTMTMSARTTMRCVKIMAKLAVLGLKYAVLRGTATIRTLAARASVKLAEATEKLENLDNYFSKGHPEQELVDRMGSLSLTEVTTLPFDLQQYAGSTTPRRNAWRRNVADRATPERCSVM